MDCTRAAGAVERNLRAVGNDTGDPDLARALGTVHTGLTTARRALDRHRTPDIRPIADGAGDLTAICTPG